MKKSLLTLILALLTLDAAASDQASEVKTDLATAMERDLKITQSELTQYTQAEKLAASLEQQAKFQFGDDYAGSWMERVSEGVYEHVVATSGKLPLLQSTRMAADGANVKQVVFSLDQLNAGMSILNDAMEKVATSSATLSSAATQPIDGIHSWYVDVRTNAIVLSVDPNSIYDATQWIADSDIDADMVRIEESTGKPSTMIDIYGGQAWSGCSVGFPVTRGNTKGFVTAGHCGGRGTSITINGSRIGSLRGSSYPGDDMAWGRVRRQDSLQPFVSSYNGGTPNDIRVNGTQEAAIGASICRSGRTTGYRCGTIVSRNASVNYGNGRVSGLTQSTACAGRGDSGGSWISGGGQAQGVTSGGQLPAGRNDNCSVDTPVTWFQPVREILDRYGLTITR